MPKNDQNVYGKIAEDPEHISQALYKSHSHILDDTSKQARQKNKYFTIFNQTAFTNGGNRNSVRLKNLWVNLVKIRGNELKKLFTNGVIFGVFSLVTSVTPIGAA